MKNEALKLQKMKSREQLRRDVFELLKNPVGVGFAALMLNHAIYKTGFYKPDAATVDHKFLWWNVGSTDPQQAAINVHDSNAAFIMLCSVVYAWNYKRAPSVNEESISSVKDAITAVPKLLTQGVA